MRGLVVGALFTIVMACSCASAASAETAPSLSASFSQSTASIGSTDPLTFTITGGDGPVGDVGFSVFLPAGLNVAASSSSQCGGTLTTTPVPQVVPVGLPVGAGEIDLSGASVAAGGSCSFSVPVAVQGAGSLTVGTTYLEAGGTYNLMGNWASASVTVSATASPATVTSAFSPSTVDEFRTTTWTVTIANPNTSTTLTDVRFVASPPVAAALFVPEAITRNSCGGSGTVYAGFSPANAISPNVNYGGGTIAPGAQCAISVSMSPKLPFDQATLPVTVVSNEGGASAASNATLTALDTWTHTKPKITRNGTITETVKLPNAGTVLLRETWRGKLVAHVQKTVMTAQELTIRLVPTAAARRALTSWRWHGCTNLHRGRSPELNDVIDAHRPAAQMTSHNEAAGLRGPPAPLADPARL